MNKDDIKNEWILSWFSVGGGIGKQAEWVDGSMAIFARAVSRQVTDYLIN